MGSALNALDGRRVAVTRAAAQAGDLLALLRDRGAEAIACPTIEVRPPESYAALDAALRALDRYDWITFTSANAVGAVADRLAALRIGSPTTPRLAAVGTGTARSLGERLRVPDFVPREALAEALGSELPDVAARRILFPRGDLASDALATKLRARGALVDDVIAYRTVGGEGAGELARLMRIGGLDAILFMSASSVRNLLEALTAEANHLPLGARRPAVICIGPETARAATEGGLTVNAVATEKTASGIVDAAERWFEKGQVLGPRS